MLLAAVLRRLSRLCAQGVLGFDHITNAIAATSRVLTGQFFHLPHKIGKILVFHAVSDPTRVVAPAEMKEPSLVINASTDVTKQHEVGRTQIVPIVRTTKPEAVPLQIAHRIFSKMANAFGFAVNNVHRERILAALDQPARNISFGVRHLIRQQGKRQLS